MCDATLQRGQDHLLSLLQDQGSLGEYRARGAPGSCELFGRGDVAQCSLVAKQ